MLKISFGNYFAKLTNKRKISFALKFYCTYSDFLENLDIFLKKTDQNVANIIVKLFL